MKPSIRRRLEQLSERFEEVTALLADGSVQHDMDRFRKLSREYAQNEPLAKAFADYRQLETDAETARDMLQDPEMADLAREEAAQIDRQA